MIFAVKDTLLLPFFCTNILEEIVQNKGSQHLCSQDIQKCKRLRNFLPKEIASHELICFLNSHSQSNCISNSTMYFVSQRIYFHSFQLYLLGISHVPANVQGAKNIIVDKINMVSISLEMINRIIGVFQGFKILKTIQSLNGLNYQGWKSSIFRP